MSRTKQGSDRITILVLGAGGRVGRAVVAHLERSGRQVAIRTVGRYATGEHDAFDSELGEALMDVDVVVNLAGVAHLERGTDAEDLDRLTAANLHLPVVLARRCAERGVALIHVSSSKADDPRSAYGWSKAMCDATLVTSFGPAFRSAGVPLVIVKPPALLIAPFDAGKLSRLRWLGRLPERLLPRRTMPVLAQSRFTTTIEDIMLQCVEPQNDSPLEAGMHTVRWAPDELDDLHSIRDAMRDARQNRPR